jgi:glycosyltransferase involved in cell wall biosynthesis
VIFLKFLMTSTFYPPHHIGGDANHVKYLAEELSKLGHEVHVFYNKDAFVVKKRNSPPVIASQQDAIIHIYKSPLNLTPYVVYFFGNSPHIIKAFNTLINKTKPEIVHHHNVSLLGYGIINKRGPYANIYTAHDYWLICPQNDLRRNGIRECFGKSCIACALKRKKPPQLWRYYDSFKKNLCDLDLIIAPSTYLQQRLSREFDIKSVVIQNFAPLPPSYINRNVYSDYYLFVGSLEEHKGIMNLLEVFRESYDKIGARLLIVGKGSLETRIEHFIKKHSLTNSIVFIGSVNKGELYSLYQSARALIIPSTWPENSPLVALEALSVGTPVIASNRGGLPEIVGKVDPKLIFRDFFELGNLLSSFHRDNLPSSRIREIYHKNFSPRAFIQKYIEAIHSLTG